MRGSAGVVRPMVAVQRSSTVSWAQCGLVVVVGLPVAVVLFMIFWPSDYY